MKTTAPILWNKQIVTLYDYDDSTEYCFQLRWKPGSDFEVLNPKTNQWALLQGVKGEQVLTEYTLSKLDNRISTVVGCRLDVQTKEQRDEWWAEAHKRMRTLPKSEEVDDNLYGYGDDNRYI